MSATADRLTVLCSAHYRGLVGLAAYLTGDRAGAEEVVQDAYVSVLGRWGGVRDLQRAEAHLRQAVVGRSRVRQRHEQPGHDDEVLRALAALPRRQREAVVLRCYADLSEAQTAHAIGTSPGAVSSSTTRALTSLQHLLEEGATTPEERLRELLQAHDDVPVTGDALTRIRARLQARRSRLLLPAAALAGLLLAAAAGAYAVTATDSGSAQPRPRPVVTAAPTPTVCTGGLCPEPRRPSPSTSTAEVTTSAGGVPVWPFTTDRQAADWLAAPGSRAWASDPVQVTQHLLDDVLALPGTAVGTAGRRSDLVQVVVKAAGRPVSVVRLEQVGPSADGPWSVTGASSEDVGIRSPGAGATVDSPLTVTGQLTGASVHVQLLTSEGLRLADAHRGGATQLWTQQLRWSSNRWAVGAIVASAYDGANLRALALTPVLRGGTGTAAASAGATLLAVQDGHVVLADAVTGQVLRQLSFPTGGDVDSDPARGGSDAVVWVSTDRTACRSAIVLDAGEASGTTVDTEPVRRALPSLSAGGRVLGWVEAACAAGAAESVLVRGPDGRLVTAARAPGPVTSLAVRDDGTALVALAGRSLLLPAGGSFAGARPLRAPAGCTVDAPAWDGAVVTAWQHCADGSRLTRYAGDGSPTSTAPAVGAAVVRTSVAGGFVLVVLADGTPARFEAGRLTPVPDGKRLLNASW